MRSDTSPEPVSKSAKRLELAFRNWGLLLVTIFTMLALVGQYLQSQRDFDSMEEHTAVRLGNLANLTRDIVHRQAVSVQQLFGVLELSMESGTNESGTVILPNSAQLQRIRAIYESSLPALELLVLDEHANYVAE